MSENYLVLNGNRIDLTEEEVKRLMLEKKKDDVWRKPNEDDPEGYPYCISIDGTVTPYLWGDDEEDNRIYENGNICFDREIMEKRALKRILHDRLDRFSRQNGWNDEKIKEHQKKHYICFDVRARSCDVCFVRYTYDFEKVYFVSEEIARKAVEEIVKPFCEKHPEILF